MAASWLEIGPAHSTVEAMEGNDMVEGRGRPAGNTLESAKSQTQRWQPLLPNLQRVNAAASATGRTRFTALLHHVDVAALERAFGRQRRAASPGFSISCGRFSQGPPKPADSPCRAAGPLINASAPIAPEALCFPARWLLVGGIPAGEGL